ncbi:hypothetical protein [Pedobacter sp. AJM]|uniref:hypothetical protein n=1 Tax=Pedobacter sp. AJM TaxID=2003629 RepID=UPI000B4A671B|nr:hypothetical protein [Pedobacter sp. AJM]OWK68713.1 hypothetical protein CBW18_20750 [Pedobacter sp. AJM]
MRILNDIGKKKVIMYLMMLLVIYLAWVGSFQKTIAAIWLNHQLTQAQQADAEPDAGFRQLARKHTFYQQVLKGYQVRNQDRENRLWQSVSGLAIYSEVDISYDKQKVIAETDTIAIMKGTVSDRFRFRGQYRRLLSLLDTIEKSKGIGRLSEVSITLPKQDTGVAPSDQLDMALKLSGVLH